VKLRFAVDQAECLRRGIDCPRSIITVEVNPEKLDQASRETLASRLEGGIDVCWLNPEGKKEWRNPSDVDLDTAIELGLAKPRLIEAKAPTLEALIEACLANDPQAVLDRVLTDKQRAAALRALEEPTP
jgi:hypothetical protein